MYKLQHISYFIIRGSLKTLICDSLYKLSRLDQQCRSIISTVKLTLIHQAFIWRVQIKVANQEPVYIINFPIFVHIVWRHEMEDLEISEIKVEGGNQK